MNQLFKILVGAQAVYSAIMIAMIFVYAWVVWKKDKYRRAMIILFTCSHLFLIFFTYVAIYLNQHSIHMLLWWLLVLGFGASDFCLFMLWIRLLKFKDKGDAQILKKSN